MDHSTLNTEDLTQGTDQLRIKTLGENHRAPKAQAQGGDLIIALGEIHRVARAQAPGEDLVAIQAHVESPLMDQEGGRYLREPLMIHPVQQ